MAFDDLVKIKSYFGLICSKVVLHKAHHVCVLVCNIVQGLMKSLVVVKVADAIHVGEVAVSGVTATASEAKGVKAESGECDLLS